MAKPKRTHDKRRAASASEPTADKAEQSKPQQQDGGRETIEAIVVALILAFLFRTFEAEAFVIPTGSMAPTLLGRHKDVECDQCRFHFTIGASEEVDPNDGYLVSRIRTANCPNCLYEMTADTVLDLPVFTGDRILVNKFPYEIGEPERFDVIVFKYPEDPTTNYIKRLIGLPGETIEIRQGDPYKLTEQGPQILRKQDPNKQRELQILVYDNDHPARALQEAGWPERWAAVKKQNSFDGVAGWSEDDQGWTAEPNERSFAIEAAKTADGAHRWLRYRHFPASPSDWRNVLNELPFESPRPKLITDYCGYNAYTRAGGMTTEFGYYWVGDLTVSCQVELTDIKPNAELVLELIEGFRKYRCRIDVNAGQVTLFHPRDGSRDEDDEDAQEVLATGQTVMKGAGQYNITFANVDDRLCLWIDDGGWLDSNEPTLTAEYTPFGGLPRQPPSDDDLTPVGIAARGLEARVSHLLLERDIYYRSEIRHPDDEFLDDARQQQRTIHEHDREEDPYEQDLTRLLSDPVAWFEEYQKYLSASMTDGDDGIYKDVDFSFTMGPDEYFVMGDNSPRSKDSRLWSNSRHAERRHAVPKSALVGKAFFIYWPHGIPFLNDGRGFPADGNSNLKKVHLVNRFLFHRTGPGQIDKDGYPWHRFPFYPNVSRMKRIR